MADIKEYKQLTCIRLKSWKVLYTQASLEEVAEKLSDKEKDYIVVDWVWFNRMTSVDEFYPYDADDLDLFILSKPKDVQEKLRKILKEREKNWFETKWVEHLRSIYEKNYLSNKGSTNDN